MHPSMGNAIEIVKRLPLILQMRLPAGSDSHVVASSCSLFPPWAPMRRIRSIPLGFALLVGTFFFTPAACAADQPPPWLEIHSTHFTVITDAGEKKGREAALRFEQMRAVFATLLGKDRLNQPVPLTILALKNDKSYYQVAPLVHLQGQAPNNLGNAQPIAVPGFFLPGEDQDFIVLNLFEEEPWRAVAHDFAFMLLSSNYPPAPGWFDDGLAE